MFFDPAYQSLKNGLVGYWSPVATGPTGLQLLDLSGQNNHGTLNGMDAPTDWVDSPYGKVLDFDGTNDSVNTDLKTDFTDFTIAGWYRSTGAALGNFDRIADNVYSVTNTGTNTGFALCRQSSSLNTWGCYLIANGVVPTPIVVTLSDGNWHLLVATRKGTTLTVYGDGGAVSSSGTVSSAAFTNQPLKIGYSSIAANHNAFLGQIGDVSYWNRALNPSEVQALYSLGPGKLLRRNPNVSIAKRKWWPGVKTPKSRPIIPTQRGIKSGPIFYDPKASWFRNGLVGHWCPNLTGPTGTQLLDLSGQNNNGTLTNMDAPTDWVQTEKGLALDFDGTDDYVSQASLPVYAASNLRTWACWCYSRAFDGQSQANDMFGRDRIGIQRDWLMGAYDANNNDSNASLAMNLWGTSGGNLTVFTTTEALVTDRWQLAVATYNGSGSASGIQLYIDGVNYAVDSSFTGGTYGSDSATSNELWIGVRPGRNNQDLFWNGRIGDVAIWNRALTASEIQQLYQRGPGGFAARKPYRRSSYSPAPKKIFKSRIDRKRSVSLVHPDHDYEWITNGLVGFWCPSLTGATGTQLLDLSGQNNNGTLTNMDAPTDWVDSAQGLALDFDGSNDRIDISDNFKQSLPMTYDCWVMRTADWHFAGNCLFWAKPDATFNGSGFYIEPGSTASFSNNTLIVVDGGATNYLRLNQAGNTSFPLNTWTHFAFTISSATSGQFYLNGIAASTTVNGTLAITATSNAKYVFNNSPGYGNYTQGRLSRFAIWNRALNPSEIQTLYQLGPRMGFSRSPSRSPTWMVEADETIGNRRRRIICGGKN